MYKLKLKYMCVKAFCIPELLFCLRYEAFHERICPQAINVSAVPQIELG